MITNRQSVPGGPPVSCVQCPTCQTYVPLPQGHVPVVNNPMRTTIQSGAVPLTGYASSQPPVYTIPAPQTIYANAAFVHPPLALSEKEQSWQAHFPKLPVLILSTVQIIFTVIIVLLEIGSLAVLSGYRATGVGIWCAIPFFSAGVLTFVLVYRKNRARIWATRALIAQVTLLIFAFILIGITGNYVQNSSYLAGFWSFIPSEYHTKHQIMQAQLAFAILLLFSGCCYIAIYAYVSFIALWRPFHSLDIDDHCRELIRAFPFH